MIPRAPSRASIGLPNARHAVGSTVAAAALFLAVSARAETAVQMDWEPGTETTAKISGEAKPLDSAGSGDGVYGRFDGDLTLTVGLGVEVGAGARAGVLGRALYYYTAGVVVGYADALGGDARMGRVLFVGAELRPLFLPRWSLDKQTGVPLLDLTLDSLSLGFGAYFGAERDAELAAQSGFEAAVGLGVPLFGTAEGLWLEGRGTWRSGLWGSGTGALILLSLYETLLSPALR